MSPSQAEMLLDSVPPGLLDGETEGPAPRGDLAIVFTDIQNSTALWETVPDAMNTALHMHDDILRATLRTHHGYEVKVIGDGFMVAFQTAKDALTWCLETQWELLNAEWPAEILSTPHGEEKDDKAGNTVFRGLKVRMSIHWGAPIVLLNAITQRMEYIGPMVHRTARCMSKAKGGQVVVTQDFLVAAKKALNGIEARDGKLEDGANDQGTHSLELTVWSRVSRLIVQIQTRPRKYSKLLGT